MKIIRIKLELIKFYNDGMFQFSKLASKFEEYVSSENLYIKFHQGFIDPFNGFNLW